MTRHELAELAGFLVGCAGAIGAILLAFPLFHLLRAREAIEDLERNIDGTTAADDRMAELRGSLHDLRMHVRARRRTAVRIGIIGVILLFATMVLLLAQGMFLYL